MEGKKHKIYFTLVKNKEIRGEMDFTQQVLSGYGKILSCVGWGEMGNHRTSDAISLPLIKWHPLRFSRPHGIEKNFNKYVKAIREINVNTEAGRVPV